MPKNAALWRFVDLLFEFHKHLVVTTEAEMRAQQTRKLIEVDSLLGYSVV
jgi:hypothetical protein